MNQAEAIQIVIDHATIEWGFLPCKNAHKTLYQGDFCTTMQSALAELTSISEFRVPKSWEIILPREKFYAIAEHKTSSIITMNLHIRIGDQLKLEIETGGLEIKRTVSYIEEIDNQSTTRKLEVMGH